MSMFRFGFLATFTLYLVLLLSEYLRPGFVSTNGNVHWLWVVMAFWVIIDVAMKKRRGFDLEDEEEPRGRFVGSFVRFSVLTILGTFAGLLAWHVGEAFGGIRLLFALVAAVTPMFLVRSYRIE
jgi:hypothetical protein